MRVAIAKNDFSHAGQRIGFIPAAEVPRSCEPSLVLGSPPVRLSHENPGVAKNRKT
jgi:hypothetical protein